MTKPVPLDFDPFVIEWLPPPTPELDLERGWNMVVPNKFYYTL